MLAAVLSSKAGRIIDSNREIHDMTQKVFVNQDKKTYPEGTTIAEIVKKTNYNDKSYNVVRNGKLVKKEDYQNITIDENDKIRILPFAMGG